MIRPSSFFFFFFFNDTATTEIYTLSLHDALPISLKTLIFLFTYMPLILNSTSPFQALILLQLSHLYLMPLILSTPGSLLIDFLLILIKTDYLLIGTQQQSSQITDSLLSFHGIALVPASSARNLG